ncbi:hypothetical protein EZV63_00615 [Streptomyces sp. VN1]|nr:hypothetical protein EZV63_00615 [Streptomyces sp. VN1]
MHVDLLVGERSRAHDINENIMASHVSLPAGARRQSVSRAQRPTARRARRGKSGPACPSGVSRGRSAAGRPSRPGCRRQQVRPVYHAPSTPEAEPIQVTPGPTHCSLLGPQSSISMTMCEPSEVQWL